MDQFQCPENVFLEKCHYPVASWLSMLSWIFRLASGIASWNIKPETKGSKGRDHRNGGVHHGPPHPGDFAVEPVEVCAIRNGQFVNIYARTLELEQTCDKGIPSLSRSLSMHLHPRT